MTAEPQRTSSLDNEPALHTLLTLYRERPELQSRFPEAVDWDFRRLIAWASHVGAGTEADVAADLLRPFTAWYEANNVEPGPEQAPWQEWRGCWAAAAIDLRSLDETMKDNVRTAFNQHLTSLALLVLEFNVRIALEVGTQYGHSTVALLDPLKENNGRLFSIDVEPCSEAASRVHDANLSHWWTFLRGDATTLRPPSFPEELELLFIDTFHLYSQTKRELEHFAPYLKPGSWIVLHDAVTFPGVSKAVREFMQARPGSFRFYPFMHQHGLLLLRRV